MLIVKFDAVSETHSLNCTELRKQSYVKGLVLSVSKVDVKVEPTETHTLSFEGYELALHLNPALVELELAGLH